MVIVTGFASLDSAIQAVRLGAYDYLTKPFSLGQIDVVLQRIHDIQVLQAENKRLTRQVSQKDAVDLRQALLMRLDGIETRLTRIEAALRARSEAGRRRRPRRQRRERRSADALSGDSVSGTGRRPQ